MSDVASGLSEQELADLAALADGTLPADRRAEVEARVAGSPELQELLEQQLRAVQATRSLQTDDVPASLQSAVDAHRRARPGRARRLVPRLVLAGGVAAAAIVAAVLLTGGPGAPTIADAAQLATKQPTSPAPARTGKTKLAVQLEGVSFPYLARLYGWQALGVRHGRVDGRDATVVVYGKGRRRLGYVIVGGDGLRRPAAAETAVINGVEYQTLLLNDLLAVTWRRGGHTCVLIGQAPRAELLRLASWPLNPTR